MARDTPGCPAGERAWCTAIAAGRHDSIRGIAARPDGGVVVIGSFQQTLDLGGGPRTSGGNYEGFVLALGADGGYLWDYTFEGAGSDVAVAPDGGVFLAGGYYAPIDFGGGQRKHAGGADAYVLALAADGTYRWDWTVGGPGYDFGRGIALGPHGTLAISGHFGDGTLFVDGRAKYKRKYKRSNGSANVDGFVVAFDTDGRKRWHWTVESSDWASTDGVAFAGDDVLVTGRIQGTAAIAGRAVQLKAMDALVARLTAKGQTRWMRTFGEKSTDVAVDVAVAASGEALVVGYSSGSGLSGFMYGFDARGTTVTSVRINGIPSWVRVQSSGQILVGADNRIWAIDRADGESRPIAWQQPGSLTTESGGATVVAGYSDRRHGRDLFVLKAAAGR